MLKLVNYRTSINFNVNGGIVVFIDFNFQLKEQFICCNKSGGGPGTTLGCLVPRAPT